MSGQTADVIINHVVSLASKIYDKFLFPNESRFHNFAMYGSCQFSAFENEWLRLVDFLRYM